MNELILRSGLLFYKYYVPSMLRVLACIYIELEDSETVEVQSTFRTVRSPLADIQIHHVESQHIEWFDRDLPFDQLQQQRH